jgi:hypothetical protein
LPSCPETFLSFGEPSYFLDVAIWTQQERPNELNAAVLGFLRAIA